MSARLRAQVFIVIAVALSSLAMVLLPALGALGVVIVLLALSFAAWLVLAMMAAADEAYWRGHEEATLQRYRPVVDSWGTVNETRAAAGMPAFDSTLNSDVLDPELTRTSPVRHRSGRP